MLPCILHPCKGLISSPVTQKLKTLNGKKCKVDGFSSGCIQNWQGDIISSLLVNVMEIAINLHGM